MPWILANACLLTNFKYSSKMILMGFPARYKKKKKRRRKKKKKKQLPIEKFQIFKKNDFDVFPCPV